MVQLGMFRTSRVLVGAAVAAIAVTTLGAGSAQAVGPAYSTVFGPNCTTTVDSPVAGQTTKTDSTAPTITSVAWNHLTVTAKANATARVTVKLTDDCSGGDVYLELHNATTGLWSYPQASDLTWTVSASGVAQTWTFDIPLHGSDAGSISVAHVFVANGFQTASYDSTLTDPTLSDINFTPEGDTPDSDYHPVAPPKAAKLVVKLATTRTVDASPEPVKVNHSVTVKATLKKLTKTTYVADASQYVTLQYHLPGSSAWHSIKKVKTNSSGVASTTFIVTKKGTYGFRAVYAGSTYAAAVNSSTDGVASR